MKQSEDITRQAGCNYLIVFSFEWSAVYLQWATEYNDQILYKNQETLKVE
jgi:hypothetical protein